MVFNTLQGSSIIEQGQNEVLLLNSPPNARNRGPRPVTTQSPPVEVNFDSCAGYVESLISKGDYRKGLQCAKILVRGAPQNPQAYRLAAKACQGAGLSDQAESYTVRADTIEQALETHTEQTPVLSAHDALVRASHICDLALANISRSTRQRETRRYAHRRLSSQ